MRIDRLPNGADLGFTDLLRAGVGRMVGGRVGDCAVSMPGGSLVPTVAPGVVWVIDTAGAFTGIAGTMLRQIVAAATPLAALAANGAGNPRVDLIVARAGATWGGAPQLVVRQGAATANANARNLLGAAALQAGDTPLLAVTVPAGAQPAAFGALVSSGAAEDCRVLASDTTPAGTSKYFGGSVPPIGYKLEDGGDYNGRGDGPWAELFGAIANTHGTPTAGRFNMPPGGGRHKIGAGAGVGSDARGDALVNRAAGVVGGEQTHLLTDPEAATNTNAGTDTDGGHDHLYQGQAFAPGGGGSTTYMQPNTTFDASFNWTTDSWRSTHAHSLGGRNADAVHNNMAPFVAMPSIIHI